MSALSKDTVTILAEACGFADLSDEVTAALTQDLEYRLREITQVWAVVALFPAAREQFVGR